MVRLVIALNDTEMEALRARALRELRPTKDQARWLLRDALGIADEQPSSSTPEKEAGAGELQLR